MEMEQQELDEVYKQLMEISQYASYLYIILFFLLIVYFLNSYILYRWSVRYINRYKFNLTLLDFLVPVWNNVIYFKILKNHNKKKHRKYLSITIILLLICFIIPYFLIVLYLYLIYVKGKIFKVYLLNKNLRYLHYFSLGLLTPFVLWKER